MDLERLRPELDFALAGTAPLGAAPAWPRQPSRALVQAEARPKQKREGHSSIRKAERMGILSLSHVRSRGGALSGLILLQAIC